jgi:hypothetical protein
LAHIKNPRTDFNTGADLALDSGKAQKKEKLAKNPLENDTTELKMVEIKQYRIRENMGKILLLKKEDRISIRNVKKILKKE